MVSWMVSILLYLLLFLFTSFCGIWLYYLLIPNKRMLVVFAPILGFIWLIITSTWLSYIGLSSNQYSLYLLSVSIVISIIYLYKNRKELLQEFSKYNFLVIILSFVSGLIILFPYIKYQAFYPYIDGYTYFSIADFLLHHSYFDQADPGNYYPWLTQMKMYQVMGYRIGAQVFLSFATSIFNQSLSINLFIPVSALAQSMLVIAVWLFCNYGLKIKSKYSLIAVLFTCFHVGMPIGNLVNGFFPQHFGMIVFFIPFLFLYNIHDHNRDNISIIKISLLTSMAITSLVMTYSELLPFFVISFLIVSLYIFISGSIKKLVLRFVLMSAVFSVIFSNIALFYSMKAIPAQIKAVVGWDVKQSVWDYILQLFSMVPLFYTSTNLNNSTYWKFFVCLITILLLFFVVKGIITSRRINEKRQIYLTGVVFILLIIYFLFFKKNPWNSNELGQTWSVMKTVQYSFFLIPPLIAIAVESLNDNKRRTKILICVIALCFVSISLYNNIRFAKDMTEPMRYFTGTKQAPLSEYIKLRNSLMEEKGPIFISVPESQINHKRLISYFLQDKELISDWSKDVYINRWMPEKINNRIDSVYLIYDSNDSKSIANMKLVKKSVEAMKEGMYEAEGDKKTNVWNWSPKKSNLVLINGYGNEVSTKLSFNLWDTNKEGMNLLQVFNGKNLLKEFQVNSKIRDKVSIELNLPPGRTDLLFVYNGKINKIEGDTRELAFAIGNLEIKSE